MIASKPVDFRKGINGLAALVSTALGANPYSGDIYVFRSKRNDRLKMVVWDGSGMVLLTKVLEDRRFIWPAVHAGAVRLSASELALLLDGLDWTRVEKKPVKRPAKQQRDLIGIDRQFRADLLDFGMLNRGQHLPRDPDILVGMILERDAEIERLKVLLKAANAKPFGQRSEQLAHMVERQIRLDLGDVVHEPEVASASEGAGLPKCRARQAPILGLVATSALCRSILSGLSRSSNRHRWNVPAARESSIVSEKTRARSWLHGRQPSMSCARCARNMPAGPARPASFKPRRSLDCSTEGWPRHP